MRQLGVGGRVDARGQWRAVDRLLVGLGGARDPHLVDERPGVELAQRRHLRLATEASQAAVRRAIGTPRDAVAIAIQRIRQREDFRVRHGLQQPESEQARRGPDGAVRGCRGHGLALDPEDGVERGRDAVLDHRPAVWGEVVARGGPEGGRLSLDLFADAADGRILVALAARGVVEQGAQSGLRSELGLEHAAAPLEHGPLGERQARKRGTGLGSGARHGGAAARRRSRGRLGVAGGETRERDGNEQETANAAWVHGASVHWPCATQSAVSNRAGNGP